MSHGLLHSDYRQLITKAEGRPVVCPFHHSSVCGTLGFASLTANLCRLMLGVAMLTVNQCGLGFRRFLHDAFEPGGFVVGGLSSSFIHFSRLIRLDRIECWDPCGTRRLICSI
jgi:hypothetical protein